MQTDSADRFTTVGSEAVLEVPNPTRYFLLAVPNHAGRSSSSGSTGAGRLEQERPPLAAAATPNTVLMLETNIQQDSGAPSTRAR